MDKLIRIRSAAPDHFRFKAWRTAPGDARRGGLVVIHEIWGISDHIRETAVGFAAEGYETLCPDMFDRGRVLPGKTPWDEITGDLAAAVAALAPPVFMVGYGWGATAAWLAACRVPGIAAVSAYYGMRIVEFARETPLCPVILHIGKADMAFPPMVLDILGEAQPDLPLHLYDNAAQGFASERVEDCRPAAAALARLRTLQLFALNGVGRGEF
jgi:carboxymethylenebutenolidase